LSYFYYRNLFACNGPENLANTVKKTFSVEDIYQKDDWLKTFFEAAIRWGTPGTVRACIALGADVDCFDVEKKQQGTSIEVSSLYAAINEHNAETLKALLEAGANVEVLEELIFDLRANVFPESSEENTSPEVLKYKQILDAGTEIFSILRKAGVKVPRGRNGMKPSFIDATYGWKEYDLPDEVRALRPLWSAASPEALRLRIASGGNIDERDHDNWTALHYAAYRNYFRADAMLQILIDAGADINARGGRYGERTPLMLAAGRIRREGQALEMVKLLLRNGADFDAEDSNGHNILWWTADWWNFKRPCEELMLLEIMGEVHRTFGHGSGAARSDADVDLMTAAFWAKPERLRALLSRGANINVRSRNDYTPLMFASVYNCADAVKFLLETGADVNAQNARGDTALDLAVETMDLEVIGALHEGGALERKNTRAEEAEEERKISKLAQRLLEHGLIVSKKEAWWFEEDYDDLFKVNSTEALAKAVRNGLNVDLSTDDGWHFFKAAIKNDALDVLKTCIAMGADVNHYKGHGDTPLGAAVLHGNAEAVKILIESGLNEYSVQGIRFAYRTNYFPEAGSHRKGDKKAENFKRILDRNAEILRLLRDSGFDIPGSGLEMTFLGINVWMPEEGGIATLLRAVSSGALKRLIESGIDVNERVQKGHNEGFNVLHYLSYSHPIYGEYYDRHRMLLLLLRAGADVNAPDSGGRTPLMSITNCGEEDGYMLSLFRTVIEAGADFEADYGCGSARMKAINSSKGARKFLEEAFYDEIRRASGPAENGGAPVKAGMNLVMAARWGSSSQIKEALSHDCVNAQSESGYTPLMFAAFYNGKNAVRTLIGAGAKLEEKNARGETALILAILSGYPGIVETLIKKGADVNTSGKSGYTPLMYAIGGDMPTFFQNSKKSIVSLLIEAGADVNAKNDQGLTALMLSCAELDEADIAKQLVQAGARVNDRGKDGQTALGFARKNRRVAIESFLLSSGANPGEYGPSAAYFPEGVKRLGKYGLKI
jgi:ankyrin repeat protein